MASEYQHLGEDAKAVEAYEAEIRLAKPGSGRDDARFLLALLYKKMGKLEQALACFESARSVRLKYAVDQEVRECRKRLKEQSP